MPAPRYTEIALADLWDEAVEASGADAGPRPLEQYRADPVGFAVEVLGVARETLVWSLDEAYAAHTWDGDRDPIVQALEAIAAGEWVAVSSGTGTGKTFAMAVALLWHCAVHRDGIAVTVATKEDQMAKGVWREVARLWPGLAARFPGAELTHLRIRMDPARGDAWGAWAVTAMVGAGETSATGVQGLHAPHLLILVDEMPGVPPAVVTALKNTATDDGNIIAGFGNPDSQGDQLALFGRLRGVRPLRVSALDHPNVVTGRSVVPGAASRGSVARRAAEYGEDSPLYGSRVRGIAPEEAEDALIRRAWLEPVTERHAVLAKAAQEARLPVALGVDVAQSENGDRAAIARWRGAVLEAVAARACSNATDLGTQVWTIAVASGVDPAHIGVDPIGVGAATLNELNRLAPGPVQALNGAAAPWMALAKGADAVGGAAWELDANRFANLRAQMWWQLREDIRCGRVALPADPALVEELTAVRYGIHNGRVKLEPKEELAARLGRSPDRADAVVYGNWVRPRSLPTPGLAPGAEGRSLGWVKGKGGKGRPATVADLHPGFARPEAPVRPWAGWSGRRT